MYLNSLGNCFGWHFERARLDDNLDSLSSLNRALELAESALRSAPRNHPGRAMFQYNLSTRLANRFEVTDSLTDLNQAVELIQDVVNATPPGHPDRSRNFTHLGNMLHSRFERTGNVSLDDLNRSIDAGNESVDILSTPQHTPPEAGKHLSNLGIRLYSRCLWTASLEDLNRAIWCQDKAVSLIPQDQPDRAICLTNLAFSLKKRFDRLGHPIDIARAIDAASDAIDCASDDVRHMAAYQTNLGIVLNSRARETGSQEDLDRAIEAKTTALCLVPAEDLVGRARYLQNLGASLTLRYERLGKIDDLNEAVEVTRTATEITAPDRPTRARYLETLGRNLEIRSKEKKSPDDLNLALTSYKEAWACRNADLSFRIRSAQRAANILASQDKWSESCQLTRGAIDLLPNVSRRSLGTSDQQYVLADIAGIASMATATALNAGEDPSDALKLLELGRGITASLLMDMRGGSHELEIKHPELAQKLRIVRQELDLPAVLHHDSSNIDNMIAWEMPAKRRRELEQDLSNLTQTIRALPGFDDFLMPPPVSELTAAAKSGPVIVINLSDIRCDAFLVGHNQINLLELPDLKLEEVQVRAQYIQSYRAGDYSQIFSLLEWLWDAICRPCLDALGFDKPILDEIWPHVWWIPTGPLTHLPLHAAGRYMQKSGETVLDRVMSSYAPSIKAIMHGRQQVVHGSQDTALDQAILVGMRETPGLAADSVLQFAMEEVELVEKLCTGLNLQPNRPALRKNDVLKHLQACKIFHFAGHGQSDAVDPSASYLLLEDWETDRLTVGNLRDRSLRSTSPFLGYLSACSTGTNQVNALVDEGIHLVGALQLAGFRHVIGTLWEVDDRYCVDVARILYETLRDDGMTDMAVCQGLHRAIRKLRDGHLEGAQKNRDAKWKSKSLTRQRAEPINLHWIPYVHSGV